MTAAEQEVADVDRGLVLVAQMAAAKKELKGITERLQIRALVGTQEALKDAGREGTRYIAKGTGVEVPIIVTADCIMQSFAENSPAHARVKEAAAEKLADFYKRKVKFEATTKDGKKFREEAAAILGQEAAPAFIAACRVVDKYGVPKNGIAIRWNGDEPTDDEEGDE